MALFMLQLASGEKAVVDADAAGRTAAGEIVFERTDQFGPAVRLRTYRAEEVSAVFRQAPMDGGGYGWLPQPATGLWWCY
ncbi:hypothetical protein ACPCSF_24690 [Streptomyces griseoincarnatus]